MPYSRYQLVDPLCTQKHKTPKNTRAPTPHTHHRGLNTMTHNTCHTSDTHWSTHYLSQNTHKKTREPLPRTHHRGLKIPTPTACPLQTPTGQLTMYSKTPKHQNTREPIPKSHTIVTQKYASLLLDPLQIPTGRPTMYPKT